MLFGHVRSPLLTNASEMVDGIKPETNKRVAAGDEVLARAPSEQSRRSFQNERRNETRPHSFGAFMKSQSEPL